VEHIPAYTRYPEAFARRALDLVREPGARQFGAGAQDGEVRASAPQSLAISVQYDSVANAYVARRGHDRVNPGTRKRAQVAELDPIVANKHPQDIRILGQIILGKGYHNAARIEQCNAQPRHITKSEGMTHPLVLNQPGTVSP